jgi:outer membrane usher protein
MSLPNLTSYLKTYLNLDPTHLPVGTSLKRESYWLRPGYRGGVTVDLGLHKALFVKGYLNKKSSGSPIGFVSGGIWTAQNQLVTDSFFTDENGRFMLDQLKAGDYILKLNELGWKPLPFKVVDSGITREVDLGILIGERQEGM